MSLLKPLGDGQGYLKAGFLGFQGSGKTYTAALLAAAIREQFKLPGPIAFIDTENATEYIAPLVKELTGVLPIGVRTRDFAKLIDGTRECVEAKVSALVVDSMTHFWRSLCESYLRGINDRRAKRGLPRKYALEFQDWGKIKEEWAAWTDLFLNSPLHIIICGRAGFEYDMEKDNETGKSELRKTGIKMKTEAEFGFEPSLLVQMDIDQVPQDGGKGFLQVRKALVLKDRFAEIDGEEFVFSKQATKRDEVAAVSKAFGGHLRRLLPGSHSTVETHGGALDIDEHGDADWRQDVKRREILCEEIIGALVAGGLNGQASEDKKRRLDLFEQIFGTRSWAAIETLKSDKLRDGLRELRDALGLNTPLITDAGPPAKADPDDDVTFKQTPPAAPAPQPAATREAALPTTPPRREAPASPPPAELPLEERPAATNSLLDIATQVAIGEVLERDKGDLGKALAWMRASHRGLKPWIGEHEGLDALTPRHAAAILAAGGRTFRQTVGLNV